MTWIRGISGYTFEEYLKRIHTMSTTRLQNPKKNNL